jgi:hypothetical protein
MENGLRAACPANEWMELTRLAREEHIIKNYNSANGCERITKREKEEEIVEYK